MPTYQMGAVRAGSEPQIKCNGRDLKWVWSRKELRVRHHLVNGI